MRPDPTALDRLFFLHFPKCGGTSVDVALQRIYEKAGAGTAHLDVGAWSRAAKAVKPYEDASGAGAPYRRRLMFYLMEQHHTRYISGHFGYSLAARDRYADDWHFVTLLREPVARWFSEYFYNRYKTKTKDFRLETPLEEFVETRMAQRYGSLYVKNLVDNADIEDAASEDAIAQAIENLRHFSVVGVLDRLDLFAQDCDRRFGVQLDIGHHNKNPRSQSKQREEVTPEVEAKVKALCAPNTRVYEAVQAQLNAEGSWLTH